jgi:lipopolysaccharide export system protein LptA
MVDVNHAASRGGGLLANAPQVMYVARKRILELTGRKKLENRDFTQTLEPEQYPDATSTW